MAAKKRVKPQSKFFYTRKWTKRVDQAFINCLAWQAERGYAQSNPDQTNLTALVFAQKAVNYDQDWDHDHEFYEGKLQLLRERYTTFDAILVNPAFIWDPEANKVQASKEGWDAIVREMTWMIRRENVRNMPPIQMHRVMELRGLPTMTTASFFLGHAMTMSRTTLWTWYLVKGMSSGWNGG
ncbi:hypothetical protein Salat_2762100 [Sesamum alatum]|uniref:Myb/SANT-like domain-containing protein n=1 Tax=Sesamum alatum TaxID=300844 RepID=A0AAE2C9B0_9LAMI|nr:hypothetical protein Salat_2762100 [Sesamum alatum]